MRKTCKNKSSWGMHLILDAASCDPKAIRSKSIIAAFSKALVKEIDMVAFGAPRIVRFGSDHCKGYTLVQLIQTSNITAHFAEDTNDVYLDVFSCKAFDPRIAIACFERFFHPKKKQVRFIKRQA
jgi:S-adenosylmethionine/arginine decarboxylase-like enzyme